MSGLAPLILGLLLMAVILWERDKADQRAERRRAHRRLMREVRRQPESREWE